MGNSDGTGDNRGIKIDLELPDFPGEEFFAHAAEQWLDQAKARMAPKGMLAVAQGHQPPECKTIIDIDLSDLPSLPRDHKDYHRREEARLKAREEGADVAGQRAEEARVARQHVAQAVRGELRRGAGTLPALESSMDVSVTLHLGFLELWLSQCAWTARA